MRGLRWFILLGVVGSCRCGEEPLNERTRPTLEPAPAQVDFGDVPVGVTSVRGVTVRNRGELELEVTASRVEGATTFTTRDVPRTVVPAGEASFRVFFAPLTAGPAQATLVLSSNAVDGPEKRILLTGNGVAGTLCGPCNNPPSPRCLSPEQLLVYDPAGFCENNECRYVARAVPCAGACVTDACAAPVDGGVPDAAVPDAAVADAGTPDAGTPDAGMDPGDAGNPFTGTCGPPNIVPYVTGQTLGGFQSVPGNGYQQTIVITFNCLVREVSITIRDPDFPGNVVQAYRNGMLVDARSFVGDGTPGVLTEDTQTVTAQEIDAVHLVPDPMDYVAYLLVTYVAAP